MVGKAGMVIQLRGFNRGPDVVRERRQNVSQLLSRPAVINKVAQDELFAPGAQQAPDIMQALLPAGGLKVRCRQAENKPAEVGQGV